MIGSDLPTLLAILISAVAYVAVFPPFEWTALAWVALAPLAHVMHTRRATVAAVWAAVWAFVATGGVLVWIIPTARDYFGLSLIGAIAFLALIAVFAAAPQIALGLGLLSLGRARTSRLWPVFFALTWVTTEWLRVHTGLESPWTRLGDSLHDAPRLRQVADLAGVYGLSFLLALSGALLSDLIIGIREGGTALRARLPLLCGFGILLLATVGYGEYARRNWTAILGKPTAEFDVLMVQGNVPQSLRWSRTRSSQVLQRYRRATQEAVRAKPGQAPDLILWPENALQTSPEDATYGPAARNLARRFEAPLLFGAPRTEVHEDAVRHFNSAWFLSPDGQLSAYDKRRLLLFSEKNVLPAGPDANAPDAPIFSGGTKSVLFEAGGIRLAPLICMEALYPELAHAAARDGADVLVNLSNDGWFRGLGAGAQHLAQVRFRAIETRRPLLRITTSGISAIVLPDGEIDAQLAEGESGFLRRTIPLPPDRPSLYTRLGDVLPIAGLITVIFQALPLPGSSRPGAN